MLPIRFVSVLMPTWQGMEFLPRVLDALAAQSIELPWDFRVIDSSSKDGTWDYLIERQRSFPVPFELERIEGVEFDHGDTRNLLAARSKGDLCVFLTQDAIPAGTTWLADLVKNFEDDAVGAAYCRNVPRPDAELLTKIGSAGDPGYVEGRREERITDFAAYAQMDAHARRLLYNFNDVASAVRRELWERHPFPRTQFGEDILMARALLEAGFTVVYDDHACVEHSHDYDAEETYARAHIDAKFSAEWLNRLCVGSLNDVRVLVDQHVESDRKALQESGLDGAALDAQIQKSRELREAAFNGLYQGGLTARNDGCLTAKGFPETKVLSEDSKFLHILYVVHGFPPDTWAGTEIYTYNIAKEMERRGHRCTILHRVPAEKSAADGGPPDFHVDETEFQGLRVLRWTHRLEHRNVRDSYQHARAEEVFARLIKSEAPDIVHFQHLIHTSAGLVHVAKRAGLATIVHCHDYWALCARVQLIRPDGTICHENQGAGCYACVKDKSSGMVNAFAKLSGMAGPMLARLEKELVGSGPVAGLARGLNGMGDLMARHEYVTSAYEAADLRISPSQFLRSKYLESGRFDAHSFLFSDNGMRTDHVHAIEKAPDPEGRIRFGFVGSLVWYKGGETMVRAMTGMDPSKAILNVYGTWDPEGDEHHELLEGLAAGSAVEFKGRFDNAKLSEVYAEIDVLIVPSVWFENSPITIHEAYLTGTPVLASNIGGMAEFVHDGVDGLQYEVGDAADLQRKMQRFVDEPQLVENLSQNFMPIKTIEQDGEAMEFRYRGLVCRDRDVEALANGERLFHGSGADAQGLGETQLQGADLRLVRPGSGNALEFDIRGSGGGPRTIAVTSIALAGEQELVLGGRVLVDGEPIADLPDFGGSEEDQTQKESFVIELSSDCQKLRLEPGDGRYLRIRQVEVFCADGGVS